MGAVRGLLAGIAGIACALLMLAAGATPAMAAAAKPAAKAPLTATQHDRAARTLDKRRRIELRRAKSCRRAAARKPRRARTKLLRRARKHQARASRYAKLALRHRRAAAKLRRPVRPAAVPAAAPTPVAPPRRAPMPLGTAVSWSRIQGQPILQDILTREFGQLTPENEMKWSAIHPAQQRYNFSVTDQMVDYAVSRGKRVRGHTLVWGNQNPGWLTRGTWTRETLLAVMKEHIETVMGRYRGRVAEWDVVNEALDGDGNYQDNIWLRVIGPDYVEHAFRYARAADPDARLFYNDAGIDLVDHPHTQGALRLMTDLRARGVPVDGMGLQGHVTLTYRATAAQFAATLRRFADLGLDVAVTEMEVSLDQSGDPAELLERQRTIYGDYAQACRGEPRCTSFSTWGITDLHAWRVDAHPEWKPLLFDEAFAAKPALATVKYWITEP